MLFYDASRSSVFFSAIIHYRLIYCFCSCTNVGGTTPSYLLLKSLISSTIMCFIILLIKKYIEVPDLILLIIVAAVGIVSYYLFLLLLREKEILTLSKDFLKKYLNRKEN